MDADRGARLTEVVSELAAADTDRDVRETVARAAADLLPATVTLVATVTADGVVEPEWVVADGLYDRPLVDAEGSVAAETLRRDEPVTVDDLRDRGDDRPPEGLRAVLSVPVTDDCVLQALSTEPGAFSAADRESARLLAAQAEQALRRVRSQRRARRERDEFAALFDNVVDAALRYRVTDDDPVVERVNPAFVGIFGVDAEAATGRPVDDLPVLRRPDDSDGPVPERTAALDGERTERRVARPTESGVRRFLLRTVPVGDRGRGDEERGYVIYTDIEEAVSRAERLRRQNERLDEFASTVSHDLRNPLEVADGYLQAAIEGDTEKIDERDALREVDRALDRMDRIVDDVLAMARQGQAVVETEPVSLAEVTRAAWSGVATGDATLSVAGDATLDADRSRLAQLLENLFRNSVEHSSTGSPESGDSVEHGSTGSPESGDSVEEVGAGVSVTVSPLPGRRGFYVEDDGPGLTATERERALEAGYTTAEDGTGLGLSLVDRIAGAHGWTVSLEEGVDGGLRVAVLVGEVDEEVPAASPAVHDTED